MSPTPHICSRSSSMVRAAIASKIPIRLTIGNQRNVNQASPFVECGLPPDAVTYLEQVHKDWETDSSSVHSSWRAYFEMLKKNSNVRIFAPIGNVTPLPSRLENDFAKWNDEENVVDYLRLQLLVRSFQVRGHLLAKIDPLEIHVPKPESVTEFNYKEYGFTEADLDRTFYLGEGVLQEFKNNNIEKCTLREIIENLTRIYSSTTAIEYSHLTDINEINWIKAKIEVPFKMFFNKEEKFEILDYLIKSDTFERFVGNKFHTEKRFGLEGVECLIPAVHEVLKYSINKGVNNIIIGSPHRGRLNLLSNILHKQNESILAEFAHSSPDSVEGSGDVKYHLGMSLNYKSDQGHYVNLSLIANPSHLESVGAVVLGKTRAAIYHNDDKTMSKTLSLLLHGDASFSAQGVVYESLGMSSLPSYTVGGTVHIIVNNQIGFTTDPRFARSSPYCSDIARAIPSPIIHVNGDDVEAVVRAARLASAWRHEWKRDIVLDIVCYRRHGHNEVDQPSFTQPLMYKKIDKMVPVIDKYVEKLVNEGILTKEEIEQRKKKVWDELEDDLIKSKSYVPTSKEWISRTWPGVLTPSELCDAILPPLITGVNIEKLRTIGKRMCTIPENFTAHKLLTRVIKTRENNIAAGKNIDMSTAEALAFGTLLSQGIHVRLSGQDVERGTFSQRHAIICDQQNENRYVPLNHIAEDDCKHINHQAKIIVTNSSLSEYGVLGYELGYSFYTPQQLVLWEAQFGDFSNNAQCIIDQYITSGEKKWLQRSALVLLLPHGYDGQGPEHSSAHIDRFLQLFEDDPFSYPSLSSCTPTSFYKIHQNSNIRVVYPTTPSNLFHVLRRQVTGQIFKPLVLLESKSLLRNPLSRSSIEEMQEGTIFQPVIPEVLHPNPLTDLAPLKATIKDEVLDWMVSNTEPRIPYSLPNTFPDFKLLPFNQTKKLVVCSGQVYYQLFKARNVNKLDDVAIIRIEELAPFPFLHLKNIIDFYSDSLESVIWCQEEAMNHGAWSYVLPRLSTCIKNSKWFASGKADEYSKKLLRSAFPGGLANALGPNKTYKNAKSVRSSTYLRYAGRDSSAAPATGSHFYHKFEEDMLLSEALMDGELIKPIEYENNIPIFRK